MLNACGFPIVGLECERWHVPSAMLDDKPGARACRSLPARSRPLPRSRRLVQITLCCLSTIKAATTAHGPSLLPSAYSGLFQESRPCKCPV